MDCRYCRVGGEVSRMCTGFFFFFHTHVARNMRHIGSCECSSAIWRAKIKIFSGDQFVFSSRAPRCRQPLVFFSKSDGLRSDRGGGLAPPPSPSQIAPVRPTDSCCTTLWYFLRTFYRFSLHALARVILLVNLYTYGVRSRVIFYFLAPGYAKCVR